MEAKLIWSITLTVVLLVIFAWKLSVCPWVQLLSKPGAALTSCQRKHHSKAQKQPIPNVSQDSRSKSTLARKSSFPLWKSPHTPRVINRPETSWTKRCYKTMHAIIAIWLIKMLEIKREDWHAWAFCHLESCVAYICFIFLVVSLP